MNRIGLPMLLLTLLGGCQDQVKQIVGPRGPQGERGDAGANGASAAVVATQEPPGDNCAAGGVRVASGLDSDQNGELSVQEVTSVRYVCNGVQGGQGSKGDQGAPGETGIPGANGTAILVLANDGGIVAVDGGSVTVWIEGTPGPQGLLGPQGPVGPQGAVGPAGADGVQGPVGPQGPPGRVFGNVWKDADGGFVAFGDATVPELVTVSYVSKIEVSVRYTDVNGYIWRVNRVTGAVSSWPMPSSGSNDYYGGFLGFPTINCTGQPVLLSDGVLNDINPRFVYGINSGGTSYWVRGDAEGPSDIAVSSVAFYGPHGSCMSPIVYNYKPNPWPATMRAFVVTPKAGAAAIVKPDDFVGPLHLESTP